MGATVFITSLFFAHFDQTQAASPMSSPTPYQTPMTRSLTDAQLPGSLPYLAFRVQDRVNALALRPEEHPPVYLARAQHRAQAAQYAWEQGDQARATATIHKAQVYLHRATNECKQHDGLCDLIAPEAEKTLEQIITVLTSFHQACADDAARANLSGMLESAHVLAQTL